MFNTRIAPSPTGDFHIGTARTAYFNWLAARASGGKFILRVDDTDANRHDEKAVQVIYDAMAWLGLDYDYSFRQSDQSSQFTYKRSTEDLLNAGLATRLDDGAVLLKMPDNLPTSWHDNVAGDVPIGDEDRAVIDGLVLIKSDGSPTYHFATVIDDAFHSINYIIRGKDHLKNTPKHIAIYLQMAKASTSNANYTVPQYAHVGLIFKDGKKISKRDGAASLLKYKEAGIDSDAMLNFLLRMGWGPKIDDKTTAVLPKEAALGLFLNGGKMRNNEPNFDQAKLDSFDRKYKARKKKNVNNDVGTNNIQL
jgi:glutamyl/glutaminyl-tRNA synthetase